MPRSKPRGSSASPRGSINLERKAGLTMDFQDISSSKRPPHVTCHAPSVREKTDKTTWTGPSLLESSMRQHCTALGHSHSICLGSLCSILDGVRRSVISSSRIEGIRCSLQQMGPLLTPELMTWFKRIQISSSGPGVPKPRLRLKRRRS